LRSDRLGRATHNNPNAPEQSQVIGEVQRLSMSGDWERYAAGLVQCRAFLNRCEFQRWS